MSKCTATITRPSRDGKTQITPTMAYRCELNLEEGHPGPCANPSDLTSVDQRKHWERQSARQEEVQRHAASGLHTQSVPLTSASLMEPDGDWVDPALRVGRIHPGEPVQCPFCPDQPLEKEFVAHVRMHAPGPEGTADSPVFPSYAQASAIAAVDEAEDEVDDDRMVVEAWLWRNHATLPPRLMKAVKRLLEHSSS